MRPSVPAAVPAPPGNLLSFSARLDCCSRRHGVCGRVLRACFPAIRWLPPPPPSPAVGRISAPGPGPGCPSAPQAGGISRRPRQPPAGLIARRFTRLRLFPGWMSTTSSRLHLRQYSATPAPVVSGYSRMSRFALQIGQDTNTPRGVEKHGTTAVLVMKTSPFRQGPFRACASRENRPVCFHVTGQSGPFQEVSALFSAPVPKVISNYKQVKRRPYSLFQPLPVAAAAAGT